MSFLVAHPTPAYDAAVNTVIDCQSILDVQLLLPTALEGKDEMLAQELCKFPWLCRFKRLVIRHVSELTLQSSRSEGCVYCKWNQVELI
jgi:hypothetical protein